jgi:hypothetical protein
MKKLVWLFVILGIVTVGVLQTVAYGFEERIYILRTLEAVTPDPDVMDNAPWWEDWDPTDPPIYIVPLGAQLWSVGLRNNNGQVVNDTVKLITTGTAVGWITDFTFPPFEVSYPFYFEFPIKDPEGDLYIKADGECIVTSQDEPEDGIIMLGCNLTVIPDSDQGIVGGSATSNSLFNFGKLPGYQNGSFWTVRIDLDR